MRKFSLLLGFLITAVCAFGQQQYHNEIGIQSDNDSYLAQGSDRYYTNGIFLYYRHLLKTDANENVAGRILDFEAGQKIFNPQSGNVPNQNYIDRPFAGYLFAGAHINHLYKNESNLKLGLQLGIIGPAAEGEEAQKLIHRTFDFYPPNGWQYQIANNVVINLSGEYNRLLLRSSSIDISLSSFANLGTAFINAGIGPMLRLGNFNQLFSSFTTQSNVASGVSTPPLHRHEFFAFYKPVVQLVGYDATIQGGLFTDHSNTGAEITREINHVMLNQQVGGAYSSMRWTFSLSATFNTKDVTIMRRQHQWASAMLLYRFH